MLWRGEIIKMKLNGLKDKKAYFVKEKNMLKKMFQSQKSNKRKLR